MYESSGNSQVALKDDTAVQTFKYTREYQLVKGIAHLVSESGYVTVLLDENRNEWYSFSLQDVHTKIVQSNDVAREITWVKINCLNQLTDYRQIVKDHIEQFLWDILRAITGLYVLGYSHNDVSLDNIGIRDGRFVLFDYNLTKPNTDRTRDVHCLLRSLRYHFEVLPFDFDETMLYDLSDFVYAVQLHHHFASIKDTIMYLEKKSRILTEDKCN